jgi:hypothetical protein
MVLRAVRRARMAGRRVAGRNLLCLVAAGDTVQVRGPDHEYMDLLIRRIVAGFRGAIMKLPKNLGMLLLAVWLILFGVLTAPFLKFSFAYSGDLLAILAVVAGVLLLLQR